MIGKCNVCGHKTLKDADICSACKQSSPTSKARIFVLGDCACGHSGRQLRPDICGPCFRDQNRDQTKAARPDQYTKESLRRRYAPTRMAAILTKFNQLPEDYKQAVLEKLNAKPNL